MCIFACCFCFYAFQTKAETNIFSPEVKSILYPGWGQIETGSKLKGLAFSSAETALLGLVVYHSIKGHDYYHDYLKTNDPQKAQDFRRQTTRHDKKRNLYMGLGAIVWAVNIWDIYYFSNKNQDNACVIRHSKINFHILEEGSFQLTCCFFL